MPMSMRLTPIHAEPTLEEPPIAESSELIEVKVEQLDYSAHYPRLPAP